MGQSSGFMQTQLELYRAVRDTVKVLRHSAASHHETGMPEHGEHLEALADRLESALDALKS